MIGQTEDDSYFYNTDVRIFLTFQLCEILFDQILDLSDAVLSSHTYKYYTIHVLHQNLL